MGGTVAAPAMGTLGPEGVVALVTARLVAAAPQVGAVTAGAVAGGSIHFGPMLVAPTGFGMDVGE